MDTLTDAAILAAVLALANTVANIYYTWQLKGIKNQEAIIEHLKKQVESKDAALADMISKKNEMKRQYAQLLAEHSHKEGEVKTYKKFHGHQED